MYNKWVFIYIHIHIYIFVYIYTYIHINIYIDVCLCICIFVHVCLCVYICLDIYEGGLRSAGSVLQHTGAHCNTLQHTAKYCICKWLTERVLGVAKHCNTLQHTATHCNTLQHTIYISGLRSVGSVLPSFQAPPKTSTSAHRICSVLQCVALCCICYGVLQCAAVCFGALCCP